MSLEQAVAYAQRGRGPRLRPASGWLSLTAAEQQVADLAAAGATNPEIGGQLFMARGTVKAHLASVYRKLGVANRTALAAKIAPRE
jgi:DNA-binding CsgD family transcriptional regulator